MVAPFRKVLSSLNVNMTPADIDRILDEADLDMDGKVSYEEFVLLMTAK
jgi:Ca2+-binding EF-hand superfamily protein